MHRREFLLSAAGAAVFPMIQGYLKGLQGDDMVMLSFGRGDIASALRGEPYFDQTLLTWLKTRPYPVIDMRDAFKANFQGSRLELDKYLERYYNGHHTPRGNFFTAWALKTT